MGLMIYSPIWLAWSAYPLARHDLRRLSTCKETPSWETMENCRHMAQIRSTLRQSPLLNPSKWTCSECATTDSLWICLTCSNMACGRYTDEHALAHYNETQHSISLEMNEGYAFCYACDDYIMNDTAQGDIRNYRDILSAIRTQSITKEDRRRSGRIRSYSSTENNIENANRKEMVMSSVMASRRTTRLSRAFTAWRDLTSTTNEPSTCKAVEIEPKQTLTHTPAQRPKRSTVDTTSSTPSSSKRTRLGVTGLRNLGNTCYMNSVLQVLSNLSEFREYFLQYCPIKPVIDGHTLPEHSSHSSSLSEEVHALLNVMWSGKMSLVIPQGFLEAVWARVPGFKGYEQQDAQEFIAELLEQLCDEQSALEEEQTGTASSTRKRRRPATPSPAEPTQSLVGRLFSGQTQSLVTCQSCTSETTRLEVFTDLSLEFPAHYQDCKLTSLNYALDTCHVTEMLDAFTVQEDLGKVYSCDKCNNMCGSEMESSILSRRASRSRLTSTPSSTTPALSSTTPSTVVTRALKQIKVNRLPKILRLHLKRFRWMSGGSHRDKIGIHVQFDEHLDMSPFLVENTRGTTTQYRLCGVIIHHGRGFNCGHYTSYCWHSVGRFWMHCNDARLRCTSVEEVLASQAYILFYSRMDDDDADAGASSSREEASVNET